MEKLYLYRYGKPKNKLGFLYEKTEETILSIKISVEELLELKTCDLDTLHDKLNEYTKKQNGIYIPDKKKNGSNTKTNTKSRSKKKVLSRK